MTDETTITRKDDLATLPIADTSTLFNVSIRGWLAVIAVLTVCAMSLLNITVTEPLYTLSVGIVAFYFGQNTKKQT